jgi:hypothetical protein
MSRRAWILAAGGMFLSGFSYLPGAAVAASGTNEVRWTFDSYLYGDQQKITTSSLNPGNGVFQQPQTIYNWDSRLDFKWLINDGKIIARPRWTLTQDKAKNDLTSEEKTTTLGKIDLMDGFYEQIWNRKTSTTIGVQVYQWGPGELFNPSNPFFRFNNQQQTYTFKEKGKVLARLNYSFDIERSLLLIAEPVSNNEPYWLEGQDFKPQFVVKYEKNRKNTRNNYAFLLGREAQNATFIGEYAQYEFKSGLSAYLDFKHSQGLVHYAPKPNASGSYDMLLQGESSKDISHLGLVGFRYEGDVDFRIEYLYNSLGYNKDEYDAAVSSAGNFMSPNYVRNIRRFLYSGLNLMTQHYIYASLRVTDPGHLKDLNLYLRTLNSIQTTSNMVQTEFDKAVGNAFVIFGSYSIFTGKEDSEFRLLDDWRAQLGLKYTL